MSFKDVVVGGDFLSELPLRSTPSLCKKVIGGLSVCCKPFSKLSVIKQNDSVCFIARFKKTLDR